MVVAVVVEFSFYVHGWLLRLTTKEGGNVEIHNFCARWFRVRTADP
jgi:hypothetical protein